MDKTKIQDKKLVELLIPSRVSEAPLHMSGIVRLAKLPIECKLDDIERKG